MSLRQGVTAQEEMKIKQHIAKKGSWDSLVEKCRPTDEKHPTPYLDGVDMKAVKAIYDQLTQKHEDAQELGYDDILHHERTVADHRNKEKAVAAANRERISSGLSPLPPHPELVHPKDKKAPVAKPAGGIDDLTGKNKK